MFNVWPTVAEMGAQGFEIVRRTIETAAV